MENFFTRYKNPLALMAVLFIQVVALATQVKRPEGAKPGSTGSGTRLIRVWTVTAFTPVEKVFVSTGRFFRNGWHNYADLRGIRKQNRELQDEVARLQMEQVRLKQDADQARRLQVLLDFKEKFISKTVAAQVIVNGTALRELQINENMSDEKVESGEHVITSGGDRIYPKGYSVGTVIGATPDRENDPFLVIKIKPAADLNRLEEVLVITKMTDDSQATASGPAPMRAADILSQRLPSVPKVDPNAPKTLVAPQTGVVGPKSSPTPAKINKPVTTGSEQKPGTGGVQPKPPAPGTAIPTPTPSKAGEAKKQPASGQTVIPPSATGSAPASPKSTPKKVKTPPVAPDSPTPAPSSTPTATPTPAANQEKPPQ